MTTTHPAFTELKDVARGYISLLHDMKDVATRAEAANTITDAHDPDESPYAEMPRQELVVRLRDALERDDYVEYFKLLQFFMDNCSLLELRIEAATNALTAELIRCLKPVSRHVLLTAFDAYFDVTVDVLSQHIGDMVSDHIAARTASSNGS